jgi:LacI family transcriptional regulator
MRRQLHRPATLKDVAQASGYSINTVSRALRDKEDISPEAMELIRKTAAELGYINNAQASSLRLGRTNTIAVILGDISNPHFAIMMKEIETRARLDGYSSFLLNTNENLSLEREALQTALNKNVDGIIICPSQQDDSNIRYLLNIGIPFVQIGRYFNSLEASYVVCNDELGGYQAAKYLLDQGHRDILLLTGPPYISSARERQTGFKRAFKEHHLKLRPELIREVPITGCSEVIASILREGLHFTAVFAFSDMLAWEAWNCLNKAGLKVPKDCSIVGFDYIQSRFAIPFPLSTISSYKAKMSTTAVECLLSIMKGGEKFSANIIDTELIKGETVLPLFHQPHHIPRELREDQG